MLIWFNPKLRPKDGQEILILVKDSFTHEGYAILSGLFRAEDGMYRLDAGHGESLDNAVGWMPAKNLFPEV